jgi:putative ABC transport system permease protein
MRSELGRYGRGGVQVLAGATSSAFPEYRAGVQISFSLEDLRAAEETGADVVEAILPYKTGGETLLLVEAGGRVQRLDVSASDERTFAYRNFRLSAGRAYDEGDVEAGAPVAVLGFDAAGDLFGAPASAVGHTIRIEGSPFEVIGVAARKGEQYIDPSRPDDRLVHIPITAAHARLGWSEQIQNFLLVPRAGVEPEVAVRGALEALGRRAGFHPDDIEAIRRNDTSRLLRGVDFAYRGFVFFIGIAGTVTLLVGGVGIANLQLVVLAERIVEIGIATTLGARNATLVAQAVLETTLVAWAASSAGVLLGLAGCFALRQFPPSGLFPVPIVSGTVAAITFVTLVSVAAIAALLPALRVRRMDIASALRASS